MALMVIAGAMSGCALRTKTPIPVLTYGKMDASENDHLMVLLRGIGSDHRVFEREGFLDLITARNLPFDIVAPAAHFGYYRDKSLDTRLKEDIIDPARAMGYRRIWLVGASMGGLGAILYSRRYADDLAGVIMVSPFLGWSGITKEINAAGGIGEWEPGVYEEDDYQRLIWDWLREYKRSGADRLPIYLAYGQEDSMCGAHKLLSTVLPDDHVVSVAGGHDIATFLRLWETVLQKYDTQLRR